MKITVINNSDSVVPCPGVRSVAAGSSITLTGRSWTEYMDLLSNYGSDEVIVYGEVEAIDRPPIVLEMKTPADAAAGVDTVAAEGFQLRDLSGNAAPISTMEFYLGVFDDSGFTTLATNATLDTAAAGTIVSGGGTHLLVVTPSATGEVSVTLTDTVDETVYLRAWPKGTDWPVQATGSHSNTFTA